MADTNTTTTPATTTAVATPPAPKKLKKNANAKSLTLATAIEQIATLHEAWLTPVTRATPGALLDVLVAGIHERVVEQVPEAVTVTWHINYRGIPHPAFERKSFGSMERAEKAAKAWVKEMVWRIFTCDVTDVERDHPAAGGKTEEEVVDAIHTARDAFLWEQAAAVPCTVGYFSDELLFPHLVQNGTISFVERRSGGREHLAPVTPAAA